jgi:hypothetical protein
MASVEMTMFFRRGGEEQTTANTTADPYGMTDEKQAEADTTATATACGEILEARDETVSGAH